MSFKRFNSNSSALYNESSMGNSNNNNNNANQEPDPAPITSSKIVVLGEPGTGKTALVYRFVSNEFVNKFGEIEEAFRKNVTVDGNSILLEVMDVIAYEEYQAIRDQIAKNCDGFVLVYSVTKPNSFGKPLQDIYDRILRMKDLPSVPVVLVGAMSDSADRVITTAQGEEFAKSNGWPFFETSAMHGVRVNEVFEELARQLFLNKSSPSFAARGTVRK